ncbi:MAG: 4Fe-4S binding protein [Chloroflexota bacterium]|nr:4Fe-4S binding protein [Chloroflexota bacterium]
MADLSVNFCGVKFKNPILAASAEPTLNLNMMRKCIEAGAGGVVAKSISSIYGMRKLSKYSTWRYLNEKHEVARGKVPRMFTLYGRAGASLVPPKEWMKMLKEVKVIADANGAVVIGSGMGPTIPDWVEQAKMFEDIGIPIMECNFGCPHPYAMDLPAKMGMEIGQDMELSSAIIEAISSAVKIPVLAKCTQQIPDMVDMAKAMKVNGAAGVTISNRFVGFVVDVENGKPLISGWSGVGGPWVKPLTLRWISKVHVAMNEFQISGSNGPYDWKDIAEFMMSGATTVQVCSVIMLKGIAYITEMVAGLNSFLDRKKWSARDIIGMAAKQALTYDQMYDLGRSRSTIDEEKCTMCGNCLESCFYDAIGTDGEKVWVNDNCVGCGICYSVCPSDAVDMSELKPFVDPEK